MNDLDMKEFNKELIANTRIYKSLDTMAIGLEEKYYFLKYLFQNIEMIDAQNMEICDEEYVGLHTNVDGYYYDEDNNTYNLYVAAYNSQDSVINITADEINEHYIKISNFITKSIDGTYVDFGDDSISYDISEALHNGYKNGEIIVNVLTNFNVAEEIQKDGTEEISNVRVSFKTYDLEDLSIQFKNITQSEIVLDCVEKFNKSIPAVIISTTPEIDVYMCSMKGLWLSTLYKEDSIRLLDSNVRSYLKRTAKVNAGILNTIKNSPEEFVSYNNGISAVATNIQKENFDGNLNFVNINKLYNFQIVNGGQTTATLFESWKDQDIENLNKIVVPMKLTVVKSMINTEELIRNISLYSNTQTAIKRSDPPSNLSYYLRIKELSKKCVSTIDDNSYICYFERTNGEYFTEKKRNKSSEGFNICNPKDKAFTKIDLAQAINAWEQLPYIVCLGREKNFEIFNDRVKKQMEEPDEEYFKNAYALIILYRSINKIIANLKLSYKSNVVAYTLSLISKIYKKRLNLNKIWENKCIDSEIEQVVYDVVFIINHIIKNANEDHPEPRMWARKPECWEIIKEINPKVEITLTNHVVEFFTSNEAVDYIENEDNFYDSVVWMKMLLWNSKYKTLTKTQINLVKQLKSGVNVVKFNKKQIEYAKEIFLEAVKHGFNYN